MPLVARLSLLLGPEHFLHVAKARDVVVAPRQQHRARGRAGRRDVETRRTHPALGECIEVRRLNLAPVAAEVGEGHVIGDDEEDVGFLSGDQRSAAEDKR